MSIKEEIFIAVKVGFDAYDCRAYNNEVITNWIMEIIEKRIDEKILSITKDRLTGTHDFEGDSNLESQIDMLQEFKEELLK